jgi:hypothetical protein
MSRPVSTIQQEIRDLTMAEKEEIPVTLLEELDGPADEGVESAWLEEVERRGSEIDSGAVKSIPAADVLSRLESA